ncbi:MAG TPA: DUF1549 and DUF1553 domain-containing protein [Steroidobacteraceae bacterium]|nr:DUF1549 and DUF1553 domain-containing protein [Steroidobacteraceae bacterium]
MKKSLHVCVVTLASAAFTVGVGAADPQYDTKPTASTTSAPARPARPIQAPHWAYEPIQNPAVPAVKHKEWVRTPIDAFVAAKLEASNLDPSPDADKATLIRRATLDTWGLLPTPEEVKAFVNDRSAQAYEKLVDGLLASQRYGERWGKRWLDLTRYADSDGYNADGTRPNAWRYRDYVIQAFNQDKPFDRFVEEQVAGDELWPEQQSALIATGFLRNYPDEINARDLELKKTEIATDLVDTVGSVLLGQTVGCARCHDHKFDKISQREYYQLQAYFQNASARDDVPAVTGKEWDAYQAQLERYNDATKDIRAKMDELLQPTIDKLEADRLQGFTPSTRAALEKPAEQRDAWDQWIYQRSLWTLSGRSRNAENRLKEKDKETYAKYEVLKTELAKYDELKPQNPGNISTIFELGPQSPSTHILASGIFDRPLEEVQPAVPAAFTSEQPTIQPTGHSSGRRTALAQWIVAEDNPLVARVFVNRVWSQYFNHGIADTVSDFGKQGEKPINPELLDHLAFTFVHDDHWSIKKLQRRILLSSVYRQSSAPNEKAIQIDPNDRLLAAFPRQRLDAEQIRDSLLAASGLLVEQFGGPPVMPPAPSNFLLGNNRNAWTNSENPRDQHRRSVYVFIRRNMPYPMLETFDGANPNTVHARRDVSTTPTQALTLVNSDLVYEWSRALAGRAIREGGGDENARIDRLYQILFARAPKPEETQKLLAFLNEQQSIVEGQLAQNQKVALPEGYGVSKSVYDRVDKLYASLYGRPADRFERAALVEYISSEAQKADAPPVSDDYGYQPGLGAKKSDGPTRRELARAAAFVDLTHALANSNEFSYRF